MDLNQANPVGLGFDILVLTGQEVIVKDLLDLLDVAELVGLEHVKEFGAAGAAVGAVAVVSHAESDDDAVAPPATAAAASSSSLIPSWLPWLPNSLSKYLRRLEVTAAAPPPPSHPLRPFSLTSVVRLLIVIRSSLFSLFLRRQVGFPNIHWN